MSSGTHGTIGPTDKQCFPGVNTACAAARLRQRQQSQPGSFVEMRSVGPALGALHMKKYSMRAACSSPCGAGWQRLTIGVDFVLGRRVAPGNRH
jgi:hypothetical protein